MKPIYLLLIIALIGCQDDDNDQQLSPSDDRYEFVGTWLCTETGINPQTPPTTFDIEITWGVENIDGTNSEVIYIKNFNNLGYGDFPYGIVNGNTLSIPSVMPSGNGQAVNSRYVLGSGTLQNNQINATYSVKYNNITKTFTAQFTK